MYDYELYDAHTGYRALVIREIWNGRAHIRTVIAERTHFADARTAAKWAEGKIAALVADDQSFHNDPITRHYGL